MQLSPPIAPIQPVRQSGQCTRKSPTDKIAALSGRTRTNTNEMDLSSPQRWLLIRHSTKLSEDRCTNWLRSRKIAFDERVPIHGEELPSVDYYSRIVVFGGVPQVYTKIQPQWMRRELQFINSALSNDVPCLGICLGAQLLAHALGAKVQAHPDRLREVGYHWIYPCKSGTFLKRPTRFLQWHSAGFDLPNECEHLARSQLFEIQAFRHPSNSYGFQFHPEVTSDLLRHWQMRHRDAKADWLGPFDRCLHRLESYRHSRTVSSWFDGFLDSWNGPADRDMK